MVGLIQVSLSKPETEVPTVMVSNSINMPALGSFIPTCIEHRVYINNCNTMGKQKVPVFKKLIVELVGVRP